QPRPWISRLRAGGDGSHLDESKTEPSEGVNGVALLVESRRQTHPVRELQPHAFHWRNELVLRKCECQGSGPFREPQSSQTPVVGRFRLQAEQKGSQQRIHLNHAACCDRSERKCRTSAAKSTSRAKIPVEISKSPVKGDNDAVPERRALGPFCPM